MKTELHPVIAELLNTKFNDNYWIPAEVHAYRQMMNDFTRIASFTEVETISIHELKFVPPELPAFKIRIYNADPLDLKPVLVYFHGGSWIAGSMETSDSVCCTLAEGSKYVVISVDYALAPEYRFPAPLHQGLAVMEWIKNQGIYFGIDHKKIVLGGDDAGGNIAAGLVHLITQKQGYKLMGQLLVCPALYYQFDTSSHKEFDKGYLVSTEMIQNSWDTYLGNPVDGFSEFASPLLATNLLHVPPTLIYTAEYHPLRDEAELYSERLMAQGIAVSFHRFKGVTHNFWLMDGILNTARKAHKKAIEFLIHINKIIG